MECNRNLAKMMILYWVVVVTFTILDHLKLSKKEISEEDINFDQFGF